jgi:epoxyqueuosine reductase
MPDHGVPLEGTADKATPANPSGHGTTSPPAPGTAKGATDRGAARLSKTADLSRIARRADRERLAVFGAFRPQPGDSAPQGTGTLVLLGPAEPGFWAHVTAAPEFADGASDPLDRWSARVIGGLARDLRGTALFPFTGPPYHPFTSWALRSGRAWVSPVRLLVHDTAGLMVSFRGAIALPQVLSLAPTPTAAPCDNCSGRPCLSACPVGALTGEGYDLPACHRFLDRPEGADCMDRGCAVRRACPISARYGRQPVQSAYHMSRFHPA